MKSVAQLKNKKVCVATSGGMDSTALLHYLKSHEKEYGYTLSAVHCEHGIRGEESLADMRFVQNLCAAWGIPLYLFQEDCLQKAAEEKVSLETVARAFRYACFARVLEEGKADCVATAHHAQDEAETVLFRLARGTSLTGAAGMYTGREGIVRPFLHWTKADIEGYVTENGLSYCVDKTNADTEYTRNKLRLSVMPVLEETVGGAVQNLARFARLAAEDDEYLYRQSQRLLREGEEGIIVLFSEEKPLFRRACLTAIKALGLEKDYTQAHLESVFALQKSERGAYITLPKNILAKREEKGVVFTVAQEEKTFPLPSEQPFSKMGFDGGRYEVKIADTPTKTEGYVGKVLRIDADKLPQDAYFRARREGDRIEKFGGGTKSLKKYYNEEKIPVELRAYLPIIAQKEGDNVYAVCGYEIADSVKVDAETKRVSYITLWEK